MRKLLLNTTPLFRKLRQLSLLLTLLLALPLSVFGKGYRTTGNVIDVTGNNAGTLFTWETDATQTTVWRWQIACEASTITPNISTLTFTLPVGKNITLSINGYANDMSTVDSQSLRKLILDGLSNDLTVSAYLSKGSDQYNFVGSNGVFTPNNWTQSMSTDGTVYITITNNQQVPVSCTINSITVLTGQIISINELVWPEHAEDPSTGSDISGITKSVSNNVTTLSGNCAANTFFSFPLKRDEGNNNLSNLDGNYNIAYSSSNTNVAEVSGGYVTIKGSGSTIITATLTENDYYSYEQSTYSYTLTNTETYGLTIAGTAVTSANASAITGSGISGTVSFDANNKILTLNGATIDGTIESSLAILSIHLTGTNLIRGNTATLLNGIKSTNGGTLTFTADASSTLHITTTGDAASAITGFANVTMGTGAYLQTDTPTKYDTNGKNFCLQVSSANIVKELNITSTPSYPLWIGNTQFTSASTPTGFTFDATNNILTLTNVTQANPLISGLANLTIALSGDNSITKSDSSAVIRSINSQAALIIQKAGTGDGSLYLENNGSDPSASPVVKNFASINHTGLNYSSRSGSSINGASTHDAILSSATIYPLWIAASKPVTASTTSGTGWSYDAANNKLSLNNATINGSIISGLGDLTIDIQGANTIAVSDTASVIRSTNGGKLTITKTGTPASLQLRNNYHNDNYPSFHLPVIKDFASFELSDGLYLSDTRSDSNGAGHPAAYETYTHNTSSVSYSGIGLIDPSYAPTDQLRGISEVTISTNISYPIWVANTQVTPNNKNDVLSGGNAGKVSFIPASTDNGNINTLQINGISVTEKIISSLKNLTIEFSGDNNLGTSNGSNGEIHGTNPDAVITFKAISNDGIITIHTSTGYSSVVEGFANVAFDKAVAEYNNGEYFYYDQTNKRYKNNYGDLQLLTIKAPTSPTMGYNDQEKVTLSKPYPDGDIYYTITYADGKTTDVAKTKYTAEFALDAPGTVEAWVEANGVTTSSVKGKHFGYQEAQFSLLEQEELTPVLIPAIETGDNIGYATTPYAIDDANVATFDNNGKITALAIGTATLTTQLAYASNLPHTTTILNYDKKFTTQLTVNKEFNVTFAEGANYMIYYNSAHDNLTIPDGMTAAIVTGVASSGTTVETTTLTFIPGTSAVLLGKGTSTGTPTVTKYNGNDTAPTGNKLKYVDNTPVATTGYEYILYKDEFVKATGSIPDGKCYLDLTGAAPAPAPARSLGIDSDGTTDIRELRMENEERDEWYDLQGRRIEQPTKAGLYIKNGKKVIVNTK